MIKEALDKAELHTDFQVSHSRFHALQLLPRCTSHRGTLNRSSALCVIFKDDVKGGNTDRCESAAGGDAGGTAASVCGIGSGAADSSATGERSGTSEISGARLLKQ